MENTTNTQSTAGTFNTGTQEGAGFALRTNQMYTADAMTLTIFDMVKEQERSKNTLSKADIILICAVYGNLQEFHKYYIDYVNDCARRDYIYCQPPHYYLKYQIN